MMVIHRNPEWTSLKGPIAPECFWGHHIGEAVSVNTVIGFLQRINRLVRLISTDKYLPCKSTE
jgi:hypothetical protein